MSYKVQELTVLIIDSQPSVIGIIRGVLQMFGIQKIHSATTQEQGLRDAEELRPDLMIVDWEIANSTGVEFTKVFRQSSPNPYVPIIFMTSFTSKNKVVEARDAGITEFLAKPFTAEKLYKRIEEIVENPRLFIVAPEFLGPDRRRRRKDEYQGTDKRNPQNERKTQNVPRGEHSIFKNRTKVRDATIVTLPNILKQKLGHGGIEASVRLGAQDFIDNNTIDFQPLAKSLLHILATAIEKSQKNQLTGEEAINAMLYPAAQLQAQGSLFRYPFVSDIASVLVNFLETVEALDGDVLNVVCVHRDVISYILKNSRAKNTTPHDQQLQNSLIDACRRYYTIKNLL